MGSKQSSTQHLRFFGHISQVSISAFTLPENTALGFGYLPGSQMNKRYGAGTKHYLSPALVIFVQQTLNLSTQRNTKFPKQVVMLVLRRFMSVS